MSDLDHTYNLTCLVTGIAPGPAGNPLVHLRNDLGNFQLPINPQKVKGWAACIGEKVFLQVLLCPEKPPWVPDAKSEVDKILDEKKEAESGPISSEG